MIGEYLPSLRDVRRLAGAGNVVPVYREVRADLETPVSAFLKVARGPYSYLLESVEGGERMGRYSFIGTEPYRVLSRTHEEFERTRDNDRAVVASLAATGRLITGAALIMATVFFGFGVARTVMIKEMGIGMGIAIVMDATIIRALLVPATMRLLGDWNWWVPRRLARFLPAPAPLG